MANAPAPSTSTSAPSTSKGTTSTSSIPDTEGMRASDALVILEEAVCTLMESARMADRLIREILEVKAEDLGIKIDPDLNPEEALAKLVMEIREKIGFGMIHFLKRILEVVNEALNLMTRQEQSHGGRAFIAWQAVVGVVLRYKLPLNVVFRYGEKTIDELLKDRAPRAHQRFCDDRDRAQTEQKPAPAPAPAPARSPLADRLAAKAEATRQQPPRGERGGNRGHGKPAPARSETPSSSRGPADEDDDRQPPEGAHKATTLVDAVKAEAQAFASGDRRRR